MDEPQIGQGLRADVSIMQKDPPIDLDESDTKSDAKDGGRSNSEEMGDAQDDEEHKLWLPYHRV